VVDVTAEVERKIFLQAVNVRKVPRFARFGESSEGIVSAVNIGFVVLRVMKLHNPSRNVWLER
jgi:hypothetical protein